MISRVWRGWTTVANAEAYEHLLKTEVFPSIAAKGVAGYRGIQLLRRTVGDEVEFMTVMWFDSWDSVTAFAGEQYERAYVPAAARALLARFEKSSTHYEVRVQREQ